MPLAVAEARRRAGCRSASSGFSPMTSTTRPATRKASSEVEQREQRHSRPSAAAWPYGRAHSAASALDAGHQQAELALVGVGPRARRRCGRRTSRGCGRRASGSRRARPRPAGSPCRASRSSMMRRWMNSMAPMSTPRVGWPTSSTSGSRSISRASTIFCWLPPEKLAVCSRQFGGRMSYCSILLAASARIAAMSRNGAVAVVRRSSLVAEDRRSRTPSKASDQAHALAVLGHVGEAAPTRRAGVGVGRSSAERLAVRASTSPAAGRGCRRSPPAVRDWPLPATPAMPTISPARTSKATSFDARRRPCSSLTRQVLDLEHRRAGLRRALLDAQQHAAADHQLGEFARAWSRAVVTRRHHLAAAHHR